jgi:hypothetical protein
LWQRGSENAQQDKRANHDGMKPIRIGCDPRRSQNQSVPHEISPLKLRFVSTDDGIVMEAEQQTAYQRKN